jgi:hypothetical protein
MCDCGCNICEGTKPVMLNESLAPKEILSEGLKYHMDNNMPLTEHVYRAGSQKYFNLWAEARALYSRGILEVTGDDLEILTETNLGEFAIVEGKKVPLDFPIEINEVSQEELLSKILDQLKRLEMGDDDREDDLESLKKLMAKLDTSMDYVSSALTGKDTLAISVDQDVFGKGASPKKEALKEIIRTIAEEQKKKLNKPMRDSSGGKAYKVYVKDPKTKNIKTVRFGSGGLRAKINDKKARNAFAKRHKCSQKKDKTKASYWSCRLPRYAKLLGLKSNFGGFW